MDMTVRLGPFKFSLRATIDHHGPSVHSGHCTASINCCKKHSIATITQSRSLELLIAKTPPLHMLYYMNWLTHDFWTRTGGWEFDRSDGAGTPSPFHWQQVEEQAPKHVGRMMCFLLITVVPVQKLCVYIYMPFLYEFCYRTYKYTYNRSVIQYWWSCTPLHLMGLCFWGGCGSWIECHFLFSLVYQLCLALWW